MDILDAPATQDGSKNFSVEGVENDFVPPPTLLSIIRKKEELTSLSTNYSRQLFP
jgi:hypothetical protein